MTIPAPAPPADPPRHRPIRSFVRRAGRLTVAQERALAELWPRYGLDFTPQPLDLDQVFGRRAPRFVEIGFGNGEALATMAAAAPDEDFIGVEVHEPGVGHCLLRIEALGLANVRVVCHDAIDVLQRQLPPGSLAGVHLFFPDPWPKKRHHKRRIVQPDFVALVADRLEAGGILHVATDWAEYAEHIAAVVTASGRFSLADPASGRPRTRFQARGERLGHPIWEARYRRD
ncbi:MAG: tRNA (guanosine(46)-N7)-methyltransferase TrmB [Chromatiales bacterium]|jgi:tRNA (guanine-N7-)-methyltransferase|nr:tRNA (guanosine(46)-N7)-methyltransferase TrmB [Chromatiales bacterium]